MESPRPRIAIIGGGASGTLLAIRLLALGGALDVVVFEPRARLGEGVAYSTVHPLHLLNVPACGMSALPEDADHFRRWAGCAETDFVARSLYADYLRELLTSSQASAAERATLTHVRARVHDLMREERFTLHSDDGSHGAFDAVVIATGNDAPALPAALRETALPPDRLVTDPWAEGGLSEIGSAERVLIVGTGLTFVDVCLALTEKGVRVDALSRHGLLPHAHESPWRPRHAPPTWSLSTLRATDVLGYLRRSGDDWRRTLDSLRPLTSALWQAFDETQKARFVARLSRFWDVHRHRTAPEVARALSQRVSEGSVRLHRGRLVAAVCEGGRVGVTLAPRRTFTVDRIVVCTGPSAELSSDALGHRLVERGLARPGPLGLGYDVDASGALLDAEGGIDDRLLVIGPPRRGVLWETTALPEIRVQAADVARSLALRLSVVVPTAQ